MEHPSKYYIDYLLTLPLAQKIKTAELINFVESQLLPFAIAPPGKVLQEELRNSETDQLLQKEIIYLPGYLEERREALCIPEDYQTNGTYHLPSIKFQRDCKIYGLVRPNEFTHTAFEILEQNYIREMIECLLLGDVLPEDVAYYVNDKHSLSLCRLDIMHYQHYFFNTKIMSVESWMHYFKNYESGSFDGIAGFVGKRKSILAGGPPVAAMYTKIDVGIERKTMLDTVLQRIYAMFCEAAAAPQSATKVNNMVRLGKAVKDIYTTASQDSLQDLNQVLLAMKTFVIAAKEHNVQSLHELSAAIEEIDQLKGQRDYDKPRAALMPPVNLEGDFIDVEVE